MEPWCSWLAFMQAGMLERLFGVMCASVTAARQAATGVCECSSACKGKVAEQALGSQPLVCDVCTCSTVTLVRKACIERACAAPRCAPCAPMLQRPEHAVS
jgi:hypothetical protein